MDSTVPPATFQRVPGAATEQAELEQLRARVAELERELAERTRRANAAVAAAEERLYWVDRWKVDLDELMQRRAGRWAFRLTEQARRAHRVAGRIRRRLTR
jgi:cell division septum initiation protein DivIVA